MKGKMIIIAFCITMVSVSAKAQQFTIGTFNLRYDNSRDTGNLWIDRAPVVAALIRFHDFDVLGTQEGLKNQLDDLSKSLPAYDRCGKGRDDGKDKGEFSAIFFKKEKFTLLKKGDFWLSETPDTASMGWDGKCCKRICSWIYLQEKKSGRKFYFFNAHFDHEGIIARKESSKLVLKKIREIAGREAAFFTGDLNGDQFSEWYQTLANSGTLKDAFQEVDYPYAVSGSFNGFGSTKNSMGIIDHIFGASQFHFLKWGILTDTYQGKFPSDHYPVMAVVEWKK